MDGGDSHTTARRFSVPELRPPKRLKRSMSLCILHQKMINYLKISSTKEKKYKMYIPWGPNESTPRCDREQMETSIGESWGGRVHAVEHTGLYC